MADACRCLQMPGAREPRFAHGRLLRVDSKTAISFDLLAFTLPKPTSPGSRSHTPCACLSFPPVGPHSHVEWFQVLEGVLPPWRLVALEAEDLAPEALKAGPEPRRIRSGTGGTVLESAGSARGEAAREEERERYFRSEAGESGPMRSRVWAGGQRW